MASTREMTRCDDTSIARRHTPPLPRLPTALYDNTPQRTVVQPILPSNHNNEPTRCYETRNPSNRHHCHACPPHFTILHRDGQSSSPFYHRTTITNQRDATKPGIPPTTPIKSNPHQANESSPSQTQPNNLRATTEKGSLMDNGIRRAHTLDTERRGK